MKSHELAAFLLKHPNENIHMSLDISTGQNDFGNRVFSQKLDSIVPSAGITLCFVDPEYNNDIEQPQPTQSEGNN